MLQSEAGCEFVERNANPIVHRDVGGDRVVAAPEGSARMRISSGYAATTVAEIAERARVSRDTVYATVGRKPVGNPSVVEQSSDA
ncbi:MAG: TetR family transcriptional regulator [Pseudonocardiales bacterium]